MNRKIIRLLYLPLGVIHEVIKILKDSVRDIDNRKRFKKAIIEDRCKISETSKIGHCHILENCYILNSIIGDYTYISRNALVQNTTIGRYCSISHDFISGLGAHPTDRFSTSPLFYKKITLLEFL